ncbi:kazal-type serine protease inhibitor domain-containing protein 1-like [Dermacentor silvarum]|uniref:kazal-type serine protease inhibitor domain-containing protein 1-like n=1 Tax=Dermacentor silvarum TaxID=543639 RepID=UPI0021013850|nr:kazal-type serine protease inhibitor domain-containing protein 1-like [Dermacentor silvarum]
MRDVSDKFFLVAVVLLAHARGSGLPPKVFEFTFPPEVALGDEILAGCVVKKGTLGPYSIVWQKDGRELESGDRVLVSGQSKTSAALRIAAVRPEDVGNYTCVARNSFGSDSFTALLVVHGNGCPSHTFVFFIVIRPTRSRKLETPFGSQTWY